MKFINFVPSVDLFQDHNNDATFEHICNHTLFCSDLHYGHDKEFLYSGRDFQSSLEHEEWIVESWKQRATEETILFDLGDTTFKDPKAEKFKALMQLPLKKRYVLFGNHTSGAKQVYTDALGSIDNLSFPVSTERTVFVGHSMYVKINRQFLFLSHFPYEVWDGVGGNKNLSPVIHLHGHVHGNLSTSLPSHPSGKRLDVGVEVVKQVNNSPFISLGEILEIMKTKTVFVQDHHNKDVSYAL